jgi:branched-chain amino acid transport system ATP-binding protein
LALDFSERTVVMDKGRIAYDGASAALRADPDRLARLVAAE